MATETQRKALLAVTCPWCSAGPGTECTAVGGRRITTLDGGCHDARWRKAFDTAAPVITAAVVVSRGDVEVEPPPVEREPVLVGAVERPW